MLRPAGPGPGPGGVVVLRVPAERRREVPAERQLPRAPHFGRREVGDKRGRGELGDKRAAVRWVLAAVVRAVEPWVSENERIRIGS